MYGSLQISIEGSDNYNNLHRSWLWINDGMVMRGTVALEQLSIDVRTTVTVPLSSPEHHQHARRLAARALHVEW